MRHIVGRHAPYSPECVEKLFGNSQWIPNRGSESGQEGSKESRSAASWRHRRVLEMPSAIFQTVSEGEFCEIRLYGVLRSSGFRRDCCQAALLAGGTL